MQKPFKIKIEHGIPLDSVGRNKLKFIFKSMKVGDSFLYPESLRASAFTSAKRVGQKIMTAKTGDGMIRVWRVK